MFNKVKKPISSGVANVPVVIQLELLECGAASLNMILGYYEKWISLEQTRVICDVSRDGANAKNIVCAANELGLKSEGFACRVEDLMNDMTYPCIIHWGEAHFVVLKGFKNGKAYINDPSQGAITVDIKELEEHFTNIALTFEPTENFVKDGKRKSPIISILGKVSNYTSIAILMGLLTLIISIFQIIRPTFDRIYLDRIITHINNSWAAKFFIIYLIICITEILFSYIISYTNLKVRGKIEVIGSTTFLWKVLHLPMKFFTQRNAGDIQNRQNTNATISMILVSNLVPLFFDAVKMIIFLVIMIRYSLILTIIGLFSVFLDIIISTIITNKRTSLQRIQLIEESKLMSATLTGIDTIESLKSIGAEEGFLNDWTNSQAKVNKLRTNLIEKSLVYGIIPNIINQITSIVILILGGYLIIKGEFTIGMVYAISSYLNMFMEPTNKLIKAKESFQEIAVSAERVDDVMRYEDDPNVIGRDFENEEIKKLSGDIEINHATYGYAKFSKPLFDDISLKIKKGSFVAIVGKSGCGKSTLGKLISGLYTLDKGEILYDGKKISDIDRNIFNSSMAIVDQDIVLYEDTISNNIKLWDESIDDLDVICAARDASIHEDIIKKQGGFDYYLSEGAKEFSGGQKQRIDIARAFAQNPSILVMDEFTSALDNKTEKEIVNRIKLRGITCIAITHKLSIIDVCDEIIVMGDGKILDKGTKNELLNRCELFKEMVNNE